MKLYLDGKIRQWYSRGDGKGVIFLVDAKTEDEARAIMETLPLAGTVDGSPVHSRRTPDAAEGIDGRRAGSAITEDRSCHLQFCSELVLGSAW